jgi:quercetin dioxygenase-like cupin family protein
MFVRTLKSTFSSKLLELIEMTDEKANKRLSINTEGVPVNLKDIVTYHDGAIVSKEIYAKASGTITMFAFDKEQGLSEHTAPYDAFVYILEGQATISIAGKPILVDQGQLILMPAHVPHAVTPVTAFKMLLILMRVEKEKDKL